MRLLKSDLKILLFFSYFFQCNGFWESLIQNQNPRKPDLFSSAINEIFGAINSNEKPRIRQQIFVEKRGVEEDEEDQDRVEQTNDGGRIESLLGGGPGGNAAIVCPSGNRVYVHPISGDLQQCSQQLGFYNQTTCPGGTVCERFPILIPGFQDYCCWGNDTSESEILILGTTEMSITDNISGPDGSGGFVGGVISGGYTESPQPSTTQSENSDESEWISASTTQSPKTKRTRRPRPRSRKTGSTTTETPTTTTTLPLRMFEFFRTPPPRRGPRCDNPDDAALIDFGNRLRDCYYQQCPYNYRCEFNTDIRRYICCGKERDVFPPPGLPPLPEPQPVVPRPFRPRMPPPYLHGEEVENPLSQTSALLQTNDEGDDNRVTENTICPLGNEHRGILGGISFCEPANLNLICPVSHPYCVHSNIWGATVCCSSSNTLTTPIDE
uniref:Uncharacterized protein n=1 Tax=Panagrolaimus sp. PS1159 TaxID=55785 RepID=A0AC35F254_9BILA